MKDRTEAQNITLEKGMDKKGKQEFRVAVLNKLSEDGRLGQSDWNPSFSLLHMQP